MTYDEDKENLNKETLLKNELFIDDAIGFLIDRRGYKAEDLLDDEEVYDAFMSHFRSQNVNEATAIRDMMHAQNSDEEGKERMGRLMDAYDNMDSDFGFKALGDYAAGIFTAPSTYAGLISFGAGKAGAVAANQGVKIGIREVLKRNALKQGKTPVEFTVKSSGRKGVMVDGVVQEAKLAQKAMALSPAIRGGGLRAGIGAAGVEGAVGAGAVLAQEETRRETDIKENIDFSDVLIGGAASAIPGGLLGTVAGTKKFMDHYEATKVLKQSRDTIIDKVNKVYDDVTAPSLKIGEGTEAVKNERRMRRDITKNMAKRLSLEETIGEQLEKGKRLKESLLETDAATLATFDEKFKMNIAAAGADIVMRVGPRAKNIVAGSEEDLQERFTSRIVRGLSDPNVLSQEEFLKILNKYGIGEAEIEMLSIAEASELLGAGVSEAGSLLGKIGAGTRRKQGAFLQKLDAFDLELKKAGEYKSVRARKEIEEKTGTVNAGTRKRTFFENLASARVGMMTINLATTVRNTTSGYLRNYIYALDNLGSGVSNLVGGKMRLASDVTDEALKEEGERAVRLGQAQLRTGFQSLLLKDLSFLSQSRDAIVLKELLSNDLFGKSHLHKKLFRDLGDLGENLDATSGLVGAARFLNTFNTLSDNMFKRAIFTRELEKELATMGAEDAAQRNLSLAAKEPEGIFSMSTPNVSAVVNETKLSSVPDEMIGRAMDKAVEFTYQRGDWERDTAFGYIANGVIGLSQSAPGSLFIPFGKYIVNQAKFAYEYMPVLGWQDFGLGILDKPNVTETTLNTISNKIGKQFAGTATLGAFMMARQQFGDETTGAFEYKDPTSREMVNAEAAIGPFSVYALLADYIYRTKRDIPTETFTRDVAKAITGGQFRPNSGLENADRILRTITAKDLESPEKIGRVFAEATGNIMNGFTVGAGLFKDIAATISPDYRIIPNNERVNWFEHMVSMGLKSFPEEVREDEMRRESPTRVGGLRYASPILRQVTGLSFQEARNVAELEFDRLRIPYKQIAPTKIEFDPELTNEAKQIMGQYVNREIASYINSPDYQRLPSDEEKRYHLRKEINHFRAEANNRVLNMDKYATKKDLDRVGKALFFRLSKEEQSFARVLYERNGMDLDKEKDFTTALNLLRQYKQRERRRNR